MEWDIIAAIAFNKELIKVEAYILITEVLYEFKELHIPFLYSPDIEITIQQFNHLKVKRFLSKSTPLGLIINA